MEYVSVFDLKMPPGMHVIVKDVLLITDLLSLTDVLYVLYLLLLLMCLN